MTSDVRPIDELANLITHGFGLLLSLVATVFLLWMAADRSPATQIACGVYGLTLILLYGASTLSHTFHDLELRRLFRMLDQAAIFLMIAGSFTPFAVFYLLHDWWWLLLVAMWILAFAGALLMLRLRDLSGTAKVTYGLLGWLPAVSLYELFRQAPAELLVWLLAGGAFYSTGTVFLRLSHRGRYIHALWHTFVVAGSICHYVAVLVHLSRPH